MKKNIVSALFLTAMSLTAVAQSGTNSPYSQYGLGALSDQTSGFNRGMNGVGLGFREHNQVNFINPASYSSMDSLTFIFDVGVSGQVTNFKENGKKLNANNADFEYAVAGFRAFRHLGMSFGILPFTNVGYSYSSTNPLNAGSTATYTNAYSGSGGLHQIYLGAGWEPLKGLSIGANVAYLWGDITRTVSNSYSDSYANTLSKAYNVDVRSYNLMFGAQYQFVLNKKESFTLGATYTLGHKLGADPQCVVQSYNSQTGVAYTDTMTVKNGLEIPTMLGVGLAWNHDNKLKVGVDYSLQKWGSVQFPQYKVVDNKAAYLLTKNLFTDRHKVNLGVDYCDNERSRHFLGRIHYRAGASYATSYQKINGLDGPKELSVSAGFGIPIMNGWNNRSILNISGQWVHQSAKSLITENTFRINIGLTFNERWFMKWKVE